MRIKIACEALNNVRFEAKLEKEDTADVSPWRFILKSIKTPRINNQIRAREVRLISEKRENLGVFLLEKAIEYARERNLDLIEISGNPNLPVCKIMDMGKYFYQQKKKKKAQKEKTNAGRLKSVRISPRISKHDLETKALLAKKFLKKDYKVRVEVFLKGREKALSNFAKDKLENFLQEIEKEIKIKEEGKLKRTPRGMEIMISKK